MSIDLVIALLVFLVSINYWISRSVLYPPFLFCTMWFLDMSLYRLHLTPIDPLHSDTLGIIGLGAALFSFGGGMAMLVPQNLIEARLVLTRFPARNTIVKTALILFLACGIPLQIVSLFHQATLGVGTTVFQRARSAALVSNAGPPAILTYFNLWSLYAAPLFLLEACDTSFWIMASIAFLSSLLSTGRVPFLMLIGSLICAQLMASNRQKFWPALKFARLPIFLFISLFFGLIFLTKDTTGFGESIGAILLVFFVNYIVGPAVAFDYFLWHPRSYANAPHHTFKFFLGIGSALHLAAYQPAGPEDFVLVPFPTNVFTVYRYYVGDFGIYGALLVMLLIGFFTTALYRKARTGSFLGIYFFSITLFATFMSIFSDEYSAFGSYIDELLFAMIYIVLRSIPLRVLPRLESGYGVS
jgi:oligosaccharide repeat unit polymerase